jgi:hypothetical protein
MSESNSSDGAVGYHFRSYAGGGAHYRLISVNLLLRAQEYTLHDLQLQMFELLCQLPGHTPCFSHIKISLDLQTFICF